MKSKLIVTLSISVLMVVFSQKLQAQDDVQYLFDMNNVKLTGFGNTNHEFSMIDGAFGVSTGGSGAFLFNYSFHIGLYSLSVLTNHYREDIYPADYNPAVNPNQEPLFTSNQLKFEHGGLWLGYAHKPSKLLHWGANLKIGGGKISLYDKDLDFSDFEEHHRDRIAAITPEFDVELNLARWCKMNVGVGYRFVLFVDDNTYVNNLGETKTLYQANKFSSPLASIKFMFGVFGPKKNKFEIEDIDR